MVRVVILLGRAHRDSSLDVFAGTLIDLPVNGYLMVLYYSL